MKFDTPSWVRHLRQKAFLSQRFHPPPKGITTLITQGIDGEPFQAHFYYDGVWYHVDAKGQMTNAVKVQHDIYWQEQ